MKTSNRVGIRTCSDYSPFGVELDSRTVSGGYRYGFNDKESIDEVSGDKNSYDFGARMYNPRIGKFMSIDPQASSYPFMSPYCYAANNPILLIDFNGNGPKVAVIIGTEENNDFKQHVAYLKSQGYDIIYAETGQEVLEKLHLRTTNGDVPITNLNIFSHGDEEYGVLGNYGNSGIYTEEGFNSAIEDQANYYAFENERVDEAGNDMPSEEDYEKARIYVEQNAITASIISMSVENGQIVFEENATITLLGCNLGMQREIVAFREATYGFPPPNSLAEDLSYFIEVAVIAASREVRENSKGQKYESLGLTSPADNYTSKKERTVDGDWIKFNPDGSQEKIGEKIINVATNEGN